MMGQPFLPVLLGSTMNAYSMARSFYEAYRIKSIVIDRIPQQVATEDSELLKYIQINQLNRQEVFIESLQKIATQYKSKELLLLACDDYYATSISQNRDVLNKSFTVPYVDESLMSQLTDRESMQQVCEKYGFNYPQTVTVTYDTFQEFEIPFEYPVIIKASNTVAYWACSFPGKKKVFVANNEVETTAIFEAFYTSSYKDPLTVQQYIQGDDSHLRVIEAYVGKDGKVKLMGLGNVILEEHSPDGLGSYAAIISTVDKQLMDQVRYFLEDIGYTGFISIDMKYDQGDGKYKMLKFHIRNGDASHFVTAAGYNLMKYVADDYMLGLKQELTYVENKHLWMIVSKEIVFKYAPNEMLNIEAKSLIRHGKWTNPLYFKEDLNFRRRNKLKINDLSYNGKYKKYYNKKGFEQ